MINNIIFKSIRKFVFIDSWNNYENGNYLEYDEIYGYSSINAFSKSILGFPYQKNNKNIFNDNETSKIAIHIHAFYVEKINKIINRINLIPIKYDLYISTTSEQKKNLLRNV